MQFRLRTLLIVLAIGPPIIGAGYLRWERNQERRQLLKMLQESREEGERQRRAWQAAMMSGLVVTPTIASSEAAAKD